MNVLTRTLFTSLVLGAAVTGYAVLADAPRRAAPGLELRPDVASRRPLSPPPTASGILGLGAELSLRPVQVARLETLAREWERRQGSIQADLDAAMAEFSLFMGEAQAGRGTTAPEIHRRASEIAVLGRALRVERRLHVEAAARLLTDTQRDRLGQIGSPTTRGGTK